ncbi:response regulator [Novosphingobium mangrovi (ex Huang et al. 2023)]|uniref:Response regulator n=1 Tax=Novosphingobium mangrovi (ex Huang et al. 2023) TaxID=2976432 RepID=A0ABT2I999_9SPHN|nr:response regulator [Novosphingobium mangrovi (ex Huang et al. 2023)]MCT2401388.1 response regulator [Novosphingobium mangrovi (ex Huang et al. 2023)]
MSEKPARILVVDDDPELRSLLQRFLSEHGYAVRAVDGGKAMDTALQREPADVIVLDLMMPGEDGLAILRRLRGQGEQVPVIMLTARGDPVDRVLGLEMGADDYLGKPFLPRELVARVAALLRRIAPERGVSNDETAQIGPFAVNFSTMAVSRDGQALTLSSREFALFAALARSPGRPLSRAQLIDRALGRDAAVTDRAIDVQVARLRRAIGDDAADPRFVRTVWGVGYVLTTGQDG